MAGSTIRCPMRGPGCQWGFVCVKRNENLCPDANCWGGETSQLCRTSTSFVYFIKQKQSNHFIVDRARKTAVVYWFKAENTAGLFYTDPRSVFCFLCHCWTCEGFIGCEEKNNYVKFSDWRKLTEKTAHYERQLYCCRLWSNLWSLYFSHDVVTAENQPDLCVVSTNSTV